MTQPLPLHGFTRPDDALRRQREQAWDRYLAAGLPNRRTPNWRHTNLRPLTKPAYTPTETSGALPAGTLSCWAETGPCLVFVDGRLDATRSSVPDGVQGLRISTLSDAIANGETGIAEIVTAETASINGALSDLNTALMNEGAVIVVGAGVVVPEPVHVLFVTTSPERPTAFHLRNVVHAGAGSQVTVVERYVGYDGQPSLTNVVTDVIADAGAQVGHVRVQQEAASAFHLADLRVTQHRDSHVTSWVISLGAALSRSGILARLDGPGAQCDLYGLYLAAGTQHVDHTTAVVHASPHATSNEVYKGILDGSSRGVFSGMVQVDPDAQKTNATQSNRNLLLSDGAHADSEPQLEIHADDVKCSHGSAIGRLDEDALFYLRARGIGLAEARQMLTMAFAREIIASVPDERLRTRIEGLIDTWLESR